jgi:ribosomal-protein-alanine N-acetyltransferase
MRANFPKLSLRPLKENDIKDWEIIERESFEQPWSIETLYYSMESPGTQVRVLEWTVDSTFRESSVQLLLGYMVYQMLPEIICLNSMAVIPEARRGRYGSLMVNKLQTMLHIDSRNEIVVFVKEDNLNAQLFFKSLGFKGIDVHQELFEDERDGFEMVYDIKEG